MGNDEPQSPLSDEQQAMWDRLDAELEPLIDGGALYQAIERLGSTLETIGDDPQSAPLRAQLLARRGECHLDLDRGEQALDDARRAIELGGGDAASYGLAGWASYHLDKTTPARDYFDQALDADSDDIALLTGRALVLMELDEFERARADLAHALHHDPEADDLLALRGEVHLQLGDLESAARDLEAAVEIAPDEPEYALMYARLLVVQGDTSRALDIASGAVDEAEDFALEALLLRSHLYLLAGDNQSARADAIRASNLYPDEAFAFVQLAHVQLADGNLDMAQKAAERAVGLDPSLSDSYMVRGTAHQMAGDNEAAKEDFERASRAPAELPMLLLGPAHDLVEGSATGFDPALLKMLREQASSQGFDPSSFADAFGGQGGPSMGGMGMDPMNMLDQIFDDSGNIRGPLKPIFKMAFKNAPKIMENLPPGLLGDLDEEQLEEMDFSEMSSEDIEERMREFYQMMKSGDAPFSPPQDGDSDDDNSGDDPS